MCVGRDHHSTREEGGNQYKEVVDFAAVRFGTRSAVCIPAGRRVTRSAGPIQYSSVVWRGKRDGSGGGEFMYNTDMLAGGSWAEV